MLISVQYFASVREARGSSSDSIELPDSADTKALLNVLRAGPLAALDPVLFARLLIAVTKSVVNTPVRLQASAAVAVFPPMTVG